MKQSIISAILSVFVFSSQLSAQTSEFRVEKIDYAKLKSNPDIIDNFDYDLLTALVSNPVLKHNLVEMMSKSYRKRSEPVLLGKSAPFLARIQSSYYDEATKRWEVVQGLGSFVKIKIDGTERTAVLSVSHLTQGQQLRIYDQKNQLVAIQPGMRLANIDEDLELIVLKDQVETPLVDLGDKGFFSSGPLNLDQGVLPENMDVPGYDRIYVSKKQHVPILKSLLPKNSAGHTLYVFTQNREDIFRKFLNENKNRHILKGSIEEMRQFLADMWDQDSILQKQLVGGGYIAGARMLPGLSGAPLIRDMPDANFLRGNLYLYYVDGLVQGHHRFENKSYFVGMTSILKLMRAFKAGKRHYTSNTRWRLKNRMTFRDYGNGVLETNIVKTPSSNFYRGDSGNAISVDGDFNPESVGFGIGMQNGHGNKIVGQFVQIDGLTLPVLADPRFQQSFPSGMELKESFDANQDLWSLAKMKYQFRDQITDYIAPYECFYQVTDKGIDLQVNKFLGENVLKWHGRKTDLQKGFNNNDFIVSNQSNKAAVEISGLFFTDLTNVGDLGSLRLAGTPTVTMLPFEGKEPQRLGCFESPQQRKFLHDNLRIETSEGFSRIFGKDMGLPPSPFK